MPILDGHYDILLYWLIRYLAHNDLRPGWVPSKGACLFFSARCSLLRRSWLDGGSSHHAAGTPGKGLAL